MRSLNGRLKTWSLLLLTIMLFSLINQHRLFAQKSFPEDDLQIIKKAVSDKGLPFRKVESSPRWLKIWIRDESRQRQEIKLSLPVALIDFFILKAEEKNRKWMESRPKFNDIWRELKRMGTGYIVEIREEAAFVRIWLE